MLLAAGHSWQQEGGIARWGGALATILVLHAGAGLSGFIVWDHTDPPTPPPAAIMLELMPVPAAPPAPQVTAPPEPTPPPPPEVDLAQLLPIPDMPLTPPDIPQPEVVLPIQDPPETPDIPKPEKPKERPKKEKVEKPKPKPKPKPQPEPEPEVVQKPTQQTVQQQAAKPAAPVQPSAAPAAPSAAEVARLNAAKVTWRGILEAHLQKFQKYPRSAQRRNIEGTVWLRFRMDRAGKVLSYAVERTSEHDVLDEAALAMIERAQPLPPLPNEVPGQSIELIIPANFNIDDR
jgi:periplasmic protein TonB